MGARLALKQRPAVFTGLGLGVIAALGFGVYWFAPHRLFIDATVHEESPKSPQVERLGAFRSLEHETIGKALLIALPDGKRVLRLEELKTSNGPDLRVLLSTAHVQDDWRVYGKQEFLDVGELKGNIGSSNYELPAGTELARFSSAVVWCRRFGVAFGAAPLDEQP